MHDNRRELEESICKMLAQGHSMAEICRRKNMPAESTAPYSGIPNLLQKANIMQNNIPAQTAQKTVTIPYDLYISISDALLRLGNFAFHASVIAGNLKTCEQNGGKGTWSNITMLECLAEDADNICGQRLADEICNVAAEQGC